MIILLVIRVSSGTQMKQFLRKEQLFMKRFLAGLLCLIFLFSVLPENASAETSCDTEVLPITFFEDGSYCVTTIIVESDLSSRSTVTGTKSKTYYTADDNPIYSVSVKGTFTYDGTTATATSAYYSYQVFSNLWSFSSGHAACSGNTATATCTFLLLGVISRTASVSLVCSPTGILS